MTIERLGSASDELKSTEYIQSTIFNIQYSIERDFAHAYDSYPQPRSFSCGPCIA